MSVLTLVLDQTLFFCYFMTNGTGWTC